VSSRDQRAVSDSGSVIGVDRGTIPDEDLHWISNAVTALQCMEMVGGAQACSIEPLSTPRRGTSSIGDCELSSSQHLVANMRIAIDGRAGAYQPLGGSAQAVAEREVAIAKLKCNEAYKWATLTAHQLHAEWATSRD